jgi:hypothetical protein
MLKLKISFCVFFILFAYYAESMENKENMPKVFSCIRRMHGAYRKNTTKLGIFVVYKIVSEYAESI